MLSSVSFTLQPIQMLIIPHMVVPALELGRSYAINALNPFDVTFMKFLELAEDFLLALGRN
jgi:hypothetical protein